MRSLILCVAVLAVAVIAQETQPLVANACREKKTCGECNAAGPQCAWCTQDKYDEKGFTRCDLVDVLTKNGCDPGNVVYHITEDTLVQNRPPQNAEEGRDPIQLSPQEVDVKLRPNEPYRLDVNFRQAENYPVDLYYIMDLSYSMDDDKAKLAELGDLLAKSMSNITKNFHLGFGSFVDKKTMPYVSTVPDKLENPCPTDHVGQCEAPYGFKNVLKLTDDTGRFKTMVENAPTSGNLDGPEGGFDAIMQAVVCHSEIGWREAARKMLLFSTDAAFHYAGDGKLGGIVKPNDGYCHLDSKGYYSESLNQDYPSIAQIVHKLEEEKVNIIFAVTSLRVPAYEQLANFIDSSSVGELEQDSSNIVELVKQNYEKISSSVKLRTLGDEDIDVKIRSNCDGTWADAAECDDVRVGQNISYEVTVEVRNCPEDPAEWQKTLEIFPSGLTEKLKINIELNCACDCQAPELTVPNSPKCNNSGTFECGACNCNPGHYGKECECDGSQSQSEDYEAACKLTNTSAVCSNHGECVCGECQCYPVTRQDPYRLFSGKFCECNDYSCDYVNGLLCGGPKQGQCVCGECVCKLGYTGKDCSCPISQETCRAANGKICNGKGVCRCGKCSCTEENVKGPTCEDCPTCPGRCEANKDCVLCKAHESGPLSEEDCIANCTHVTVVHNTVEGNEKWKKCQFKDEEDGCFYFFIYEYISDKVNAQKEKTCPKPPNVLAIVLGIIAAIILIGLLLLLLWKILVTLYDRREYARFEKEIEKAKWETAENPIYKQATSTFKNPTYNK